MGEVMKTASFSLAEAKFAMGDFNHLVLQNVNRAQFKVKTQRDNVAGTVLGQSHHNLRFSCLQASFSYFR